MSFEDTERITAERRMKNPDYGPDERCLVDGYGRDDAIHALPEWCSTADCGDSRCHRDTPRPGCGKHRKCRAHA